MPRVEHQPRHEKNEAAEEQPARHTRQHNAKHNLRAANRRQDDALKHMIVHLSDADGIGRLLKSVEHDGNGDNPPGEKGQIAPGDVNAPPEAETEGEKVDEGGDDAGKHMTQTADLLIHGQPFPVKNGIPAHITLPLPAPGE